MTSAIEFFEDIMKAQNDYIAMQSSGFYQRKRVVLILDPIMQKYGMSYEEAEHAARNRLSLREYLNIISRKEEQK